MHFVDHSRTVTLPTGVTEPRAFDTIVRYPAQGAPSATDVNAGAAETSAGPYPLIVFGHGFAVTPQIYAPLLQAWARAGYVVAAPYFPLGRGDAPGGPNENDLVNQPQDMRFLITRLLAQSGAKGQPLSGLIDPSHVAVAGQSDGGDTALAAAFDPRFHDPRIGAAVILAGAEIPFLSSFQFVPGGPPLLAAQGTADVVNPPGMTHAFYDSAPRPKYLLTLIDAQHLPPFTDDEPQLGIVERVTTAFLNHYLKGSARAAERLPALGNVAGESTLDAEP